MASCYLENQGNATFVVHPLSIEAQFSPINSMLTGDFTGDGRPDVLVAGNFYATETIGGQLDAGRGVLLASTGKPGRDAFRVVPNTGLSLDGDVKSVTSLRRADGSVWWLVAENNGPLRIWTPTKPTTRSL